ncbi:MAG: MBL fold metallo-hydrolase [Sphingobacteriales bacterium JAD_PAG50586_3]|nr:MAG: MBL fold metallo-hydrolase [Sphingobacteriales bacterium JAD_PAG50586_3]
MEVQLKTYPAKNGDCFLVSFGNSGERKKHMLIDCGYFDTVNNYLKTDLTLVSKNGEYLEKLILTHIDADHIQGAIKLLKDNNVENFIQIREIWHNTFRHLFKREIEEGANVDTINIQIIKQIVQRGYPKNVQKDGKSAISAEQGTAVGALILQGEYAWNSDFKNKAVCVENGRIICVDINSTIYLLSPNNEKLEKLKDLWKNELKKYDVNYLSKNDELYDDAFEMLMTWEKNALPRTPKQISATKDLNVETLITLPIIEDTTPTNGSSIAFVLQIQEKKLLFLADAHPNLILESLNEYQKNDVIFFDIIKVSHHGSMNNISKQLLDKIDSEKYIFSTNGAKHNHPDLETIASIIVRKTTFNRCLYFNYRTSNSEFFNRKDWIEKYNYSIYYIDNIPYTIEL